jgi:hypothetical protein
MQFLWRCHSVISRLRNRNTCGKVVWHTKCTIRFSLQRLYKLQYDIWWARCESLFSCAQNSHIFSCSGRHCSQDLPQTVTGQHTSIKLFDMKLYENLSSGKKTVKLSPITGCGGPYGCETSRLPHLPDNRLTGGSDVVSLTRRRAFTPRKSPGTHFITQCI